MVATGIGSWPGHDVREALRVVRGELAPDAAPDGVAALPYLPELPARGPGADMIGRTAQLLVDLPVDLQPQGWRLVDRPGRDAERARSLWRQDLDELAEVFDGYAGPLKVQVVGPWTMAAALWKSLGDKVLGDPGATRDLADSLAEGVGTHLRQVRSLVPGAQLVLQVDEPSLTAVRQGHIRSESGLRVLRTPEAEELVQLLARTVEGARTAGAVRVVAHSCAAGVPVEVFQQAGADAVSLDVTLLDRRGWEAVGALLDGGMSLWAGVLPVEGGADATSGRPRGQERKERRDQRTRLEDLVRTWRELGLPLADLNRLGVTVPCGLAGLTPDTARRTTVATVRAAEWLAGASA
ncbi:methionine synthase [Ornithinimicrobium sufpigmenti]|uniref:methionine synthase n=1 Tax=Ornithinimicrobium sufpigmenti TaxID=2508882 RepID=UPI001035F41A|nr:MULTISPECIES: methionine synthase [unclassified Ornithinimicrobium]